MTSREEREQRLPALRNIVRQVVVEYPEDVSDDKGRVTAFDVFETVRRFNRMPPGFTLPDSAGRWIRDIRKILMDLDLTTVAQHR